MQRKLEPAMGDEESLKGLNLGKCFGPSTNFRKFLLIDLFGDGEATDRRNRQASVRDGCWGTSSFKKQVQKEC